MSYATEHSSLTSQSLINIYIHSRLCRLYIINVCVCGGGDSCEYLTKGRMELHAQLRDS
jgi:hypothetical protein